MEPSLTHARFVVGSIAHHTKYTVLPSQRPPHIDLTGALVANELGSHMPRWVFGRIFGKGIGASDKSCKMGALAGVGGAAQAAFLYSSQASSKPRFKDICVNGRSS